MQRLAIFLLTAAIVLAATDAWVRLRELKTGGELRVYTKSAKQPVSAIFDEATDENLIVVIKNVQKAIPKTDITRIDYRAPKTGSRVTKETRTTVKDVDTAAPRMPGASPGPSTSTSSSVAFSGKGDFETVYRK